jgi:glycogen operon protein
MRFDGDKVLLDPSVAPSPSADYTRERVGPAAMKSVVVDIDSYDWEGDQRPAAVRRHRLRTACRGFTRHPSSGVVPERAGTYAGLIEKIPTWSTLGLRQSSSCPFFNLMQPLRRRARLTIGDMRRYHFSHPIAPTARDRT